MLIKNGRFMETQTSIFNSIPFYIQIDMISIIMWIYHLKNTFIELKLFLINRGNTEFVSINLKLSFV